MLLILRLRRGTHGRSRLSRRADERHCRRCAAGQVDLGRWVVHLLLALLSLGVYEERLLLWLLLLLLIVRVRPVLVRLPGVTMAATGDIGRWVKQGSLAVCEKGRDLRGRCCWHVSVVQGS